MTKLTYEEWKYKYCSKIMQEQLELLKITHGIEKPEELIEKCSRLENLIVKMKQTKPKKRYLEKKQRLN
jgi:serine kinase of HPr protein (carbohydrate metabolism regulator)